MECLRNDYGISDEFEFFFKGGSLKFFVPEYGWVWIESNVEYGCINPHILYHWIKWKFQVFLIWIPYLSSHR